MRIERLKIRACLILGLGLAFTSLPAGADVQLPAVIGSHMVLQRGASVPIWGTAAPGEKITVTFRDQHKTAEADAQGKWLVKLDPLKVGDPATLTVAGSNTLTVTDVLVGEVWVGSGQSNMDTTVGTYVTDTMPASPVPAVDNQGGRQGTGSKDAANKFHIRDDALAQLARGTYPQIRIISSRDTQGWREANPNTIKPFSALLFAFGQPLRKELNVPVGLMFGALGATSSEQWISRDAYQSDEACKTVLTKFAATYDFDAEQKKYGSRARRMGKSHGHAASPGRSSPGDTTTAGSGSNRHAVTAPGTTASGSLGQSASRRAAQKPLPPFHPGDVTRDLRLPHKNIGDLYELYVRPFIPFAIRGVLWDQGEGGTGIFGLDQYTLMGALIHGWRKDWGQGDFPFVYVQKPSGGGCAWDPADPVTRLGAELFTPALPANPPVATAGLERENYLRIMTYPNTAMVISSDLGGGTHPINKAGYGARACRVALGMVYGEKIEIYGPLYDSFKVEGDKIRISFTHVGQGLAFHSGDKLQGFEIAGEDKTFSWADAAIDGDTVIVSSAKVPRPVAVRYAWDKYISWANLFNKDSLPAQAFRTDQWPSD